MFHYCSVFIGFFVQLFGGTSLSRGEVLDGAFFLVMSCLSGEVSPLERGFKEKTINNTKTKNVCANFERTLRKRYIFVFMIESQSEFSSEKINISGFYRFFSLFSCSYTLRSSYRNKKYLGKGLVKK